MFIFFLFLINFSLFKFQIYSITNSTENISISPESQNLLNSLSLIPNNFSLQDQFYLSQFYAVDENYFFTQNIDTQNNDLGVMDYNFKNIYFNGEKNDYLFKFKYEMGTDAYESIMLENKSISNKNKTRRIQETLNGSDHDFYKFECKFIYGGISKKNEINKEMINVNIKKVLNLHKLIIVLGNDKYVYRGSGYQSLSYFYQKSHYCFNGRTNNIFLSKNYIILDNDNEYCIFQMIFNYPENDIKKTSYSFIINLIRRFNKSGSILNVQVQNNIFYISLNNEKIINAYDMNNLFNNIKTYTDSNNDDYLDFVVNEKTLYAIEKNFGLVIFDLKTAEIIKKIELKNPINIDKFNNPFNGKIFVGIFLNNSNLYDDFFIELYLENNNEENPYLNKIFAYKYNNKPYNFTNYLNYDGYFSYFFDKMNSNIIILRRGLVSSIPFYSYIIPLNLSSLNDYSISNTFIAPFKKSKTYIFYPIIIFPEFNYYIYFDQFKINNNTMNCCFYKHGTYSLFVNHFSDFCSNLNDFDNKNNILCNITSTYRFKVIFSKEHNYIGLIIGLIIVVIIFCAFGILIVYLKEKNEKLNLKVKSPIDKNDKKKLYTDNSGYNQKRNNKNTTRQFNCDLFLEEERNNNNNVINNNNDIINNNNDNYNNIFINRNYEINNNKNDLNTNINSENYNNLLKQSNINTEGESNNVNEINNDDNNSQNNNNKISTLYLSVNRYNNKKNLIKNNSNNDNNINNDNNDINNDINNDNNDINNNDINNNDNDINNNDNDNYPTEIIIKKSKIK